MILWSETHTSVKNSNMFKSETTQHTRREQSSREEHSLWCPLTFFLSVVSMLAVTTPSIIARRGIRVGAEAEVRAGSGLERLAVTRQRRQLSTIFSCRLAVTVAAPKLCLYGARAQPGEKLSSEWQRERTRGWSVSPCSSSSSKRMRARPRGTLTFRHNSARKRAAVLRLSPWPVHMCTCTRPKLCVGMIPETCF